MASVEQMAKVYAAAEKWARTEQTVRRVLERRRIVSATLLQQELDRNDDAVCELLALFPPAEVIPVHGDTNEINSRS